VDVFITHAGMNSVNESICKGVPMILLPHTYEQKLIADRIVELGLGISGQTHKIKSKKILDFTQQILKDIDIKKQTTKYKNIFSSEEKESHINAANEIIAYIDNQL
jgi:UDP:flavonoid glycosyltransferase YjiC (YdhE family)